MARKTNYAFDRNNRAKAKAAKREVVTIESGMVLRVRRPNGLYVWHSQ